MDDIDDVLGREVRKAMDNAKNALDEYEAKPVQELIKNAQDLISKMCVDGPERHWIMCVPVQPTDSDIVLSVALNKAGASIADLERQLAEAQRRNELLRAVADASNNYWIGLEGPASPKIIDQLATNLYDSTQAAIDGGALEDE